MQSIKNRVSKLETNSNPKAFDVFQFLWQQERENNPTLPQQPTNDWLEQQLAI